MRHLSFEVRERLYSAASDVKTYMSGPIISGPSSARGLAVICGWGGGSLKNVNKYAALWHRIGWRTATAAMSMDNTFFPASWTSMPELTRAMADECRAHRASRPDSLIVSHAFSNGGTFLKLSMLGEERQAGELALRFDGTVYDSCPSVHRRLLPAGAPIVLAVSGMPVSDVAKAMVTHVPYSLAASLAYPFMTLPPPLGLFSRLFTADGNPPRPELFVYGEKDFLIPPDQVESFVRLRESQGSTVQTLGPLRDSAHCGHLLTHPKEYAKALEAFAKSLERSCDSEQGR